MHYLAHDLEECHYYFDRLDSPALGWSFTVNHAHIQPNRIDAFMKGLDMKRCGEVRLADCRGTHEEHLRPGEGTIDFPAMFAAIEKSGYRGHYMQAFGSLDDMLKGRQTLARARGQRSVQMKRPVLGLLLVAAPLHAVEPEKMQRAKVPSPPWPPGDERGMANSSGPATTQRCAWHMAQPDARAVRALAAAQRHDAHVAVRRPLRHASRSRRRRHSGHRACVQFSEHSMQADAEPAQQGTQIDALGHFGSCSEPWDGKSPFPAEAVLYYGGLTQKDVKPTPDSPLLKLGIDKIPPIITSAVLLDAKRLHRQGQGHGRRRARVTAAHRRPC